MVGAFIIYEPYKNSLSREELEEEGGGGYRRGVVRGVRGVVVVMAEQRAF